MKRNTKLCAEVKLCAVGLSKLITSRMAKGPWVEISFDPGEPEANANKFQLKEFNSFIQAFSNCRAAAGCEPSQLQSIKLAIRCKSGVGPPKSGRTLMQSPKIRTSFNLAISIYLFLMNSTSPFEDILWYLFQTLTMGADLKFASPSSSPMLYVSLRTSTKPHFILHLRRHIFALTTCQGSRDITTQTRSFCQDTKSWIHIMTILSTCIRQLQLQYLLFSIANHAYS